jgi:organic hydroperoxide reductase OsmC/OhrA
MPLQIYLVLRGTKFAELAGMAKVGCPVSKLFNTKITLEATLL